MASRLTMAILLVMSMGLYAQQLVDPTRPLTKAARTSDGMSQDGFPNLILSAVFINGDSKHAILNGQSVAEGQNWNGFQLVKVLQGSIVLSNKQQKKEFFINKNKFKKDASHDF